MQDEEQKVLNKNLGLREFGFEDDSLKTTKFVALQALSSGLSVVESGVELARTLFTRSNKSERTKR